VAPKRKPSLRFNCYLIRDGLSDVESALQTKYRAGGSAALDRIEGSPSAPPGAVSYLGQPTEKTPRWAADLDSQFPGLATVTNRANRLVVILPVNDRRFALCFGQGAGVLDWDAIESNFGLRVAARALGPDHLTGLSSRRIDATARSQSVQVPGGSTLNDLGVVLDGEFVRRLSGKADEALLELDGSVVAGDSIAFKTDIDLHKVQSVLGGMLDIVADTEPTPAFEFIDSLEPLRKGEQLSRQLDERLAAEILGGGSDLSDSDVHLLEFAPPDDVSLDFVEEIHVVGGKREAVMTTFSIVELRRKIAEVGVRRGSSFLKSVKLIAIGPDGDPVSGLLPLRNWLVFEAGTGEARYILTLGRWFKLEESYTENLNRDLLTIENVTSTTHLPHTSASEHEGPYNSRAAGGSVDLLLMDKVEIKTSDRTNIEACDLLSRDGRLICVKRYNGSQTLSHLFSQGSVAASLLAADSTAKADFVAKVRARDPSFETVALDAPRRVTFAISIADHYDLPLDLPTFSKVNLRDFAGRLRQMRVEPSIAKISIR
jgi:uncharacterized protein (TIGR04141 family)